jgi:hypothetical protein
MRIAGSGSATARNNFSFGAQNRRRLSPYLLQFLSQEIVMTSSCIGALISRGARVAIPSAILLSANAALASQGPGGGMGTASPLTQLAMAILVYGSSAIVVGAGIIGAARGR